MEKAILSLITALYLVFWRWYTGSRKPLTPDEVEGYLDKLTARGAKPEALTRLRTFLLSDTGGDFVIVNLIKLRDQTPEEANQPGSLTPAEQLNRYTSAFLPGVIKRGGHPVLQGSTAGPAVEVWGLDHAEDWTMVGLVRYRSRRDMIESATADQFFDIHPLKTSAIQKTIAVPVSLAFQLGDPRLLVGLVALLGAALTHLFVRSKG